MTVPDQKQQKIISLLLEAEMLSSSDIYAAIGTLGESVSLVTVKRALSEMVRVGLLLSAGSGRSIKYSVSTLGRIFAEVDARAYCAIEPDKRYGLKRYNFDLFSALPTEIFSEKELGVLDRATAEYLKRTAGLSPAIQRKELERLIIELSWKSSRIEGNTYTLLDTERLIRENKEAPGHTKAEARMILNHKDAFQFVHEHADNFQTITRKNLEELHAILVNGLNVGVGLRRRPVGVVGSVYQPLDNIHQIAEAVDALSHAVLRVATPYAKALVALLGIGYIQPFEDGNKRTGRLMANALLMAHTRAPLSYRSVDEDEYREAVLVFYELNSIMPFKKILISQYDFAARNYTAR
jgi:Fic family protein